MQTAKNCNFLLFFNYEVIALLYFVKSNCAYRTCKINVLLVFFFFF